MAVFNINGREADSLEEAFAICRAEWSAMKAEAVQAQRNDALAKPTPLDRERAAAGILPRLS